jgi:hypothetical protein
MGALPAFMGVCVWGTCVAHADPRFGDSTWVAPVGAFADSSADGPRVAPPSREPLWETVLRTPFRIVFFPLRLIANGMEAAAGYLGPRVFEPKAKAPPKPGLSVGPEVIFDLNDISVGAGVSWLGFPTADAKLRLGGTVSAHDRRRVRFRGTIGERRPVSLRLRGDYDYKPNRRFYGIGNDTPDSDVSFYRLENSTAEAALLFGASPLRQIRIVSSYSGMSPHRGYFGSPLLEDVFPAPYERRTTKEFLYGVTADFAKLDDERDPSRGAHARLDLRRAVGLRPVDPDYDQWRVEGRAYIPVFAKHRVLAVRGVYTGVEPSADSPIMPFYRLAKSGGVDHFAGFTNDRFRDRQLMFARIEYRWAILPRVSAIALYERSEVAPQASSFRLADTHWAYGAGLRMGVSDVRALRLEVAKSVEGIKAALSLGGDF